MPASRQAAVGAAGCGMFLPQDLCCMRRNKPAHGRVFTFSLRAARDHREGLAMQRIKLEFPNAGGETLAGLLELPPVGTAVRSR